MEYAKIINKHSLVNLYFQPISTTMRNITTTTANTIYTTTTTNTTTDTIPANANRPTAKHRQHMIIRNRLNESCAAIRQNLYPVIDYNSMSCIYTFTYTHTNTVSLSLFFFFVTNQSHYTDLFTAVNRIKTSRFTNVVEPPVLVALGRDLFAPGTVSILCPVRLPHN